MNDPNKGVNLGQDCTPTKESTWDGIALQQRSQLGTGLHSNKGVNLGQGVHSNEGVNLGRGVHSNEGVNLGQDCTPTKESTWDNE